VIQFVHAHTPSAVSLAAVIPKLLLKKSVYDIATYILKYTRPSLDTHTSDKLFGPHPDPVPAPRSRRSSCSRAHLRVRDRRREFSTLSGCSCSGLIRTDSYSPGALGWPTRSPTFGAPAGTSSAGTPSSHLARAPAVHSLAAGRAARHVLRVALCCHTGVRERDGVQQLGALFVLMNVGAVLKHVWECATGTRVRGSWGLARMMVWTLFGGTFMLDGWARHLIACDKTISCLGYDRGNRLLMVSMFSSRIIDYRI
jgi:hypothetical protein